MLLSYYDSVYKQPRGRGVARRASQKIRASLKICLEMKTLELTQDGLRLHIYIGELDEHYHSVKGAVTESMHRI